MSGIVCEALLLVSLLTSGGSCATTPECTILFVIDGLAEGAAERLGLENFLALKQKGTYYKSVELPLPAHPKQSENYPYTSSIPNPVMMTGTVFLRPGLEMLQQKFAGLKTAFVVNAKAYESISDGYDFYEVLLPPDNDVPVVEKCRQLIEMHRPTFIRLHLQATGLGGSQCRDEKNKAMPWFCDIYHPDSPYARNAKLADELLGRLVEFLEKTGRLQKTALWVTSDHGQAKGGWHPPYEPDSKTVPLVMVGPVVRAGATFEYAEMIDIVATIAYMHNLQPPNGCIGRVLSEMFENSAEQKVPDSRRLRELNELLIAHHRMIQDPNLQKNPEFREENEKFLTIENIAMWHSHFNSVEKLVEHNRNILNRLKALKKGGD